MSSSVDVDRLRSNIAWAINHGLGARDLVPMLEQLVNHTPAGTDAARYARTQLAELLVESQPWRAALLAREVLRQEEDERAWAVLALSHTLMGNHRSAARAYRNALAISPKCASYAHNLGHLIDVVFDRPAEALSLLRRAYSAAPDEPEIAASYAHALQRAGRRGEAHSVLTKGIGCSKEAEKTLLSWAEADRSRNDEALLEHVW